MQTDRSVGLKHDGAGRRIFYADRPKRRAETRWRREAHFLCRPTKASGPKCQN